MAQNTAVPVTQADLAAVLTDLAAEVAEREASIQHVVPLEGSYGIQDCLRRAADDWASGTRAMRSLPVVNTYERAFGRPIDDDLRALLVGLDAKVITFDDIIDTRRPTQDQKICAAAVIAFTATLEFRVLPAEHAAVIADVLADYWTVLSQIPIVERRKMASIRRAESPDRRRDAARAVYAYRGRDVDAFVRVPMALHGIDGGRADCYLRDIRSFRARYLLFEDFRHIQRDLQEGHANPAIVLMNVLDDPTEVVDVIEWVYDEFGCSSAAADRYGGRLKELERRPDDLERSVSESMRVLSGNVP